MIDSIKEGLAGLLVDSANLRPLTVLFTEIPTNPDMKVSGDGMFTALALADVLVVSICVSCELLVKNYTLSCTP